MSSADDARNGGTPVSNANQQESEPFFWVSEKHTSNDIYHHGINQVLYSERTKFQEMLIADVGPYGKALFLDGCLQTSEGDEAYYHESITHPACLAIGSKPKRVLILGGGDGGTAREVLRWNSIEEVINVEIDQSVVEGCKKYLPSLSKGAFDHEKVTVIFDDANNYLKQNDYTDDTQLFDVIICDLSDPIENGPSASLFSVEFFSLLHKNLRPANGVICLQSGTMSLSENDVNLSRIVYTLNQVFEDVHMMQIFAPKYGTPLALTMASNFKLNLPDTTAIDQAFEQYLEGENYVLDGRAVHGLFAIPKCVSQVVKKGQQLLTDQSRIKLSGHGLL